MTRESYIAYGNAGSNEAVRLKLQHAIFGPNTELHLRPYLKDNQVILVVGCGTGEELCFIAKTLNNTGKVIGVDISEAQLKEATNYIKASGMDNVQLINMDLFNTSELRTEFDLIVDRFVIGNLSNPVQAIEVLVKNLKPGGVLYSEEPIIDKLCCIPESESFNIYTQLFHKFAQKTGLNYNIGKDLKSLFTNAGLSNIKAEFSQVIMNDAKHKKIIQLSLDACSFAYLEHGFMTKDEIDTLSLKISQEVINNEACRVYQVGVCHASGVLP